MSNCKDIDFGTYKNTTLLPRPKHMYPTSKSDWITVDNCMVDEILSLWKKGIWTLECCCGHCKQKGYVAVAHENHDDMIELGYEIDPKYPHVFRCKTLCDTRPNTTQSSEVDVIPAPILEMAKTIMDTVNGISPMCKWETNQHVKTWDDLEWWAKQGLKSYMAMQAAKNFNKDELGDFLLGKQSILNQLVQNIHAIKETPAENVRCDGDEKRVIGLMAIALKTNINALKSAASDATASAIVSQMTKPKRMEMQVVQRRLKALIEQNEQALEQYEKLGANNG